jgi:hypothetical protein
VAVGLLSPNPFAVWLGGTALVLGAIVFVVELAQDDSPADETTQELSGEP